MLKLERHINKSYLKLKLKCTTMTTMAPDRRAVVAEDFVILK